MTRIRNHGLICIIMNRIILCVKCKYNVIAKCGQYLIQIKGCDGWYVHISPNCHFNDISKYVLVHMWCGWVNPNISL